MTVRRAAIGLAEQRRSLSFLACGAALGASCPAPCASACGDRPAPARCGIACIYRSRSSPLSESSRRQLRQCADNAWQHRSSEHPRATRAGRPRWCVPGVRRAGCSAIGSSQRAGLPTLPGRAHNPQRPGYPCGNRAFPLGESRHAPMRRRTCSLSSVHGRPSALVAPIGSRHIDQSGGPPPGSRNAASGRVM